MRYRAGEQIFQASSPADTPARRGQVRMQSFSGRWIVGPGEAFGERALLTNQPHNANAVAETDVDVWTLAKSDFDMLMARYPSLAISMSRMLTQRLKRMEQVALAKPRGETGYSSGAPAPAAKETTCPPADSRHSHTNRRKLGRHGNV